MMFCFDMSFAVVLLVCKMISVYGHRCVAVQPVAVRSEHIFELRVKFVNDFCTFPGDVEFACIYDC